LTPERIKPEILRRSILPGPKLIPLVIKVKLLAVKRSRKVFVSF